ncbi:MAG: ICEBs1 excisionase [Clostridia bacterium]|nr:ICEBs1 excisionase [Clostridia bacterium]
MKDEIFVTAAELAQIAKISVGHAYKIIHRLNEELEQMGYLVFSGRVPRKYLEERLYGFAKGA